MPPAIYWVYILLCDNNHYYTGYTSNITRRYRDHCSGRGKCKYTRSFKPQRMAQCWLVDGDKAMAMRVEHYIKKLTRVQKTKLISAPITLSQFFPTTTDEIYLTFASAETLT
jgi:putative endonuclease